MGRKKSICSMNAILQDDGKTCFTFRRGGEVVGINQLDAGHASKMYRALGELRRLIGSCYNVGYIDRQVSGSDNRNIIGKVHSILDRYPNTPTLNRIRIEIENEVK